MSNKNRQNNESDSPNNRGHRRGVKGGLKLPFDSSLKWENWALWMDRHKVGLLVTIVVYLSLAILFMTYRIVVLPSQPPKIEIEFTPEQLQEMVEQLQEKEIEQMEDMGPMENVQNKISDANSKFDASLRDSKNSDASEIYDEVEELQNRLREGQENYQRELNEIERMKEQNEKDLKKDRSAEQGSENRDAFVRGNVVASFDLEGRTASYIDIPAYKCEGAGVVVVSISVNRNGKVVAASVDSATNTSERCILDEAVASAKASRFNASTTARDPQRGTITYTFVAQ